MPRSWPGIEFERPPPAGAGRLFDASCLTCGRREAAERRCFFWSGDGNRIAYVALDLARRAIAWKVVDAAGGEPVPLVDFAPSAAFFGMISFFDQYAASHSVWSPSNDRLVFAGHVTRGGAAPDGDDRVYVLDADGVEEPREIAKGSLAFWSWN